MWGSDNEKDSRRIKLLRGARGISGQATVEAAFLMPVVLLGILIAVQPGILLWDRMVMESAAAQGCRMVETLEPGKEQAAENYVRRRLEAVPKVEVFHASPWNVAIEGNAETERVSVSVSHGVRPVPLIGAAMGLGGFLGQGGLIVQEATCSRVARDEWVMGSKFGPDMQAWQSRWEEKV